MGNNEDESSLSDAEEHVVEEEPLREFESVFRQPADYPMVYWRAFTDRVEYRYSTWGWAEISSERPIKAVRHCILLRKRIILTTYRGYQRETHQLLTETHAKALARALRRYVGPDPSPY